MELCAVGRTSRCRYRSFLVGATSTSNRARHLVFESLHSCGYFCRCLGSRSIQSVVLVAMVIAAIVVLWNLSIFCLYTLRLALKVIIAASFRNIDSFPKCVVLSLTITEITMIIVTIVRRASGILSVFCLLSWISNVSAISYPNSGILLAGTAFLPSLVFPSCSSSYS